MRRHRPHRIPGGFHPFRIGWRNPRSWRDVPKWGASSLALHSCQVKPCEWVCGESLCEVKIACFCNKILSSSPLTYTLGFSCDGMIDNLTHCVHFKRELEFLLGFDSLPSHLAIMLHFSYFLLHFWDTIRKGECEDKEQRTPWIGKATRSQILAYECHIKVNYDEELLNNIRNFLSFGLLQPLLAPLTIFPFSILARVTNANPSHSAMLMVSSPYRGPYSLKEGNQPSYFALWTHPLTGNQFLDVDFHSWKFNLMLIIALLKQHYNNPNHTKQLCPHIGPMPMKAVPFGLRWVRPYHLTHISLSDFWQGPYLTVKKSFVPLSRVGAKYTIFLSCWGWKPPIALEHHNFLVWSLMLISDHLIFI